NAHCDARELAASLARSEWAATSGYDEPVLWNNRGVALDALGRSEEAIEAYTRAMRRNPAYDVAAYNLGNAYAKLGRLDEALVAYDRALAIRADHSDALFDKALVLARLGKKRSALQVYELLVRTDVSG